MLNIKYRVLNRKKEGYYEIYTVQQRRMLFFWEDQRSFDSLSEAIQWIRDKKVTQVQTVVHVE